jgi:hypothetical protein
MKIILATLLIALNVLLAQSGHVVYLASHQHLESLQSLFLSAFIREIDEL